MRPRDACEEQIVSRASYQHIEGVVGECISVELLQCRDINGSILPEDTSQECWLRAIRTALSSSDDCFVVAHIVVGTKTGLNWPPFSVAGLGRTIEVLTDAERRRLVLAIDVCQTRCGFQMCKALLHKGCVVMLTGSKYFAGPPFSGCCAVPSALLRELESYSKPPAGFTDYFSYADFPAPASGNNQSPLATFLEEEGAGWVNVATLIRWNVALATMESHESLGAAKIEKFVSQWHDKVVRLMNGHYPFLEVATTTAGEKSIINFHVFCVDDFDHKRRLDTSELKAFHRALTKPLDKDGTRLFIGQPVSLGSSAVSVLRYAIGADSVIAALSSNDSIDGLWNVANDDITSIDRISSLARKWRRRSLIDSYPAFDDLLLIQKIHQPLVPTIALSLALPRLLSQSSFGSSGTSGRVVMMYDVTRFMSTLRRLKDAFTPYMSGGGSALHCFAVKSAPLSYLLHLVTLAERDCGCGNGGGSFGLEVASFGELKQALKSGCSAHSVVFDSPCKTDEEIRYALAKGITLNANSVEELKKIQCALRDLSRTLQASTSNIGLRINPMVGSGAIAELSTATATSKFGVLLFPDGSNRGDIVQLFIDYPFLSGVMCHVGSQGISLDLMASGAAIINTLANDVDVAVGCKRIVFIDIGGGLSSNYSSDDECPSFKDYCACLFQACPTLFTCGRTIVTEFGKALIAKSGFIVAQVEDVIDHDSATYGNTRSITAITHAGADLLLRTCYCPSKFPHRILLFDNKGAEATNRELVKTTIAGPLCFSGDVILPSSQMPRAHIGDWVAIMDAGANTMSLHSKHCSRAAPAVACFATHGERLLDVVVVKDAETIDQVLEFWG